MRWFNSITDSNNMNLSKLLEIVENRGAWLVSGQGVSKSQPWVSNWTATISLCITFTFFHGNSVFSPCLILRLTLKSLQNLCICHTFFSFDSLPSQISCSVMSDSLRPHEFSTPGLPVYHQLLEFTHTHVHRVSGAIQPSHPLSSPSPPAPNPSWHQSLF